MQVSFTGALEGGRATTLIGRIRAFGPWRCAEGETSETDRRTVLRTLAREAEEYGADALIEVRFEADEHAANDGVGLRRLVATGAAVRMAQAA
jgi:uncharacterized protein YbjQ (UPF0145 family)